MVVEDFINVKMKKERKNDNNKKDDSWENIFESL
jgi:hypothetical protein